MKLLKGVAPLSLRQTNFLMQPITPILTFPRQGGRDFSSPPRRERKRELEWECRRSIDFDELGVARNCAIPVAGLPAARLIWLNA